MDNARVIDVYAYMLEIGYTSGDIARIFTELVLGYEFIGMKRECARLVKAVYEKDRSMAEDAYVNISQVYMLGMAERRRQCTAAAS